VAVPFFLAGIGTIGAGLTLGVVQVSSLLYWFHLEALRTVAGDFRGSTSVTRTWTRDLCHLFFFFVHVFRRWDTCSTLAHGLD
jgi:hypothetical protein